MVVCISIGTSIVLVLVLVLVLVFDDRKFMKFIQTKIGWKDGEYNTGIMRHLLILYILFLFVGIHFYNPSSKKDYVEWDLILLRFVAFIFQVTFPW